MKRIFSVALVLLLALGLGVACRAQADFSADQALEIAAQVVSELAQGDYGAVRARFDQAMAAQVNDDLLDQAWQMQAAELGAFSAIEQSEIAPAQGGYSAKLLLAHERGKQVLTLTFDESGKINGMYLNPQQEASAYQPDGDLPQGVTEKLVVLFPGEERELGGSLLLPEQPAPGKPAVLLVQGSGASDRDETIGPNKPFRDIAYALAQRGVASLRFDKLTYAHPELFLGDYTVELEYLQPFTEALRVLDAEAPGHQVYLIGHSQGGMLMPWLMNKCPQLAGGIALAGSPRQLWEIQRDQNLAVIDTLPQEQRSASLAMVEAEVEKALALSSMSQEEAAGITVFGLPGAYARYLAGLDAIALAKENQKPLLILQGEADVQVTLADLEAWKAGLGEDGRYTYITYPHLSHLFMPSRGGLTIQEAMAEYANPMHVDENVLADMGDWILRQAA